MDEQLPQAPFPDRVPAPAARLLPLALCDLALVAAALALWAVDARARVHGGFLATSLAVATGGFAATAVVVALLLIVLPRDALAGQVALALTAAGVLATAALELPPFFRVLAGGPLPRGAAYVAEEVAIRFYRRAGFGPWEAPGRTLFVTEPLPRPRAAD